LEEVARDNPDVLNSPLPFVEFLQFGDNGLDLELRVWSTTLTHRKELSSAPFDKVYNYTPLQRIAPNFFRNPSISSPSGPAI
jgi:small-conductance mechanosensitive channel